MANGAARYETWSEIAYALIMTDGKPDDDRLAQQSIDMAKKLGFKLYGIGIACSDIEEFIPSPRSHVINDINELAPAMFSMLQKALIHT